MRLTVRRERKKERELKQSVVLADKITVSSKSNKKNKFFYCDIHKTLILEELATLFSIKYAHILLNFIINVKFIFIFF